MNDSLLRRARALTDAVNSAVEIVEKEHELERRIEQEQKTVNKLENQDQTDNSKAQHPTVVSNSTEPSDTTPHAKIKSSRLTSNDYKSNAITIVQDVMQSASLGESLKRNQSRSEALDTPPMSIKRDEAPDPVMNNATERKVPSTINTHSQQFHPHPTSQTPSDTSIEGSPNVADDSQGIIDHADDVKRHINSPSTESESKAFPFSERSDHVANSVHRSSARQIR